MKPQQHIEHTAEFSSRRRALFPAEEPGDSDLGCISPLDSGEGPAEVFSLRECVGDYDIIGLVVKGTAAQTPDHAALPPKTFTPGAFEESPTQKLKTPHDTSDNTKFPKLIRNKNQVDTFVNLDCKNPKVRTALFPELDMSLPSRTFYPKGESEVSQKVFSRDRKSTPRKAKKRQGFYLCNRRSRRRSCQINAGVRHKIKKRKVKKISKIAALQAAINIIENSPLNDILNESQPQEQPLAIPPPRDPTPSPEPDPTKKFFKSSRHRGVVTVHSNIKVEMSNGRLSLLTNNNPLKRSRADENHNPKRPRLVDFENDQPLIPQDDISNIIHALEETDNQEKKTEPVVLMSPTSQMCNMTSGLALNSPKKARNLNVVLEEMPSAEQPKKLFPVFYPGKTPMPAKVEQVKNSNGVKKFRGLHKDQMLLDAGQKRFGATQCPECKIVYHMGDPGDEIMHLNYHNAGHIFRFNGWKNERVVSNEFFDGKIIQIAPGDPKLWWKKVKEVIDVINRDLGYYDLQFDTINSQIFFYIKNRTIVGVLVAEAKTSAHKLLTTPQDQVDLCSEEAYPIKCGVSRIWVAQNHRKKGVATRLMDSLKRNFVFGYILKNEDIAFSSPTEMGKIFGQNYFNTPNFLIYFV